MTSSKPLLTPLALCALITLSLAGCGGKDDDYAGKPGATPAPTAESAGSPEAAVAEAAPARASVVDGVQFSRSDETVEAVLAMPAIATCSLENLVSMTDGQPSPGSAPNSYLAKRGNAYKMIGFATNTEAGTVPAGVRIVLLGGTEAYSIQARTGSERPDVAEYFKQPAFATAGYQADAAFDDVPPGDYRVFVIEAEAGATVACPSHQIVTVQ